MSLQGCATALTALIILIVVFGFVPQVQGVDDYQDSLARSRAIFNYIPRRRTSQHLLAKTRGFVLTLNKKSRRKLLNSIRTRLHPKKLEENKTLVIINQLATETEYAELRSGMNSSTVGLNVTKPLNHTHLERHSTKIKQNDTDGNPSHESPTYTSTTNGTVMPPGYSLDKISYQDKNDSSTVASEVNNNSSSDVTKGPSLIKTPPMPKSIRDEKSSNMTERVDGESRNL